MVLGKCDRPSLPAEYNNTIRYVDPWEKRCDFVLIIVTGATGVCHAVTVYSAPDDGRKGLPKHVEHTCNC